MAIIKSDIVVIGAGITGTAASLFLAQQGLRVVLLDKGRIGDEASGRNGGGVRQQYRNPAEMPLAMQAVQLWADLQDQWNCELEYVQGGSYRLMVSEEAFTEASARVAGERKAGLAVDLLDADQTRTHLPFLGSKIHLWGSTYCPSDGTANPLLAMRAFAHKAISHGVRIQTHEPVCSLTVENDRVQAVRTPNGDYQADAFINAAGPWASALVKPRGKSDHFPPGFDRDPVSRY
jgi:sarcosine oxidase subunit beta